MTPEAVLAALTDLVTPPETAIPPHEIDWAAFARQNGFEAPADYRLLVERYGVGGFGTGALPGGWLYLIDPFGTEPTLVEQSEWDRRNARGLQRHFPEQSPGWPMWPEPGGLLPWANSADGDLIGWWTIGTPDAWGTRFFGRHDDFEEFSIGATEFILRLLRGELGTPNLDGVFGSLDEGESLHFFPRGADAYRDTAWANENVTVTFAGLARVIDPGSLPSTVEIVAAREPDQMRAAHETYRARLEEVMRPANEIIEAWTAAAKEQGVKVTSVGMHRAGWDDPMHHELSCSFDPRIEPVAKRLVAELSHELDVAISEVRNLEHERIWEDIGRPRLRLLD